MNPEEYREDGMLSLVQSVTAVSDEPKPWESGPVAECARQVWPKGRPWPPEPGTFDPFVTYVDAETGEPLSR
ncbi:hypothetical protein U8D42_17265 [Mycobacterium europaeum]|uniref:hypothetical protein n=1 Tax=Mycobacterium europaeum TaxID=761804 RepID=UPI002ADF2928|nr:hypothetical protein [Mycobacterium europaeum]MEA1159783.1 hypothetical protein [Mycobacterium europaeum]